MVDEKTYSDQCNAAGTCRCCGKPLEPVALLDGFPIHTRCIARHWGDHVARIHASRCREFKTGGAAPLANPRRIRYVDGS